MVKVFLVFLMLVFGVVPLAVISFRAVSQVGATVWLLVLCFCASVASVVMDLGIRYLFVVVLTYSTLICTLLQLVYESD